MSPLSALKRWVSDPQFAKKKHFLHSLELFADLDGGELGTLAQSLHARNYRSGEVVFVEGDIGRALFILESGKVELTRKGADDKPVLLYTLKPGEFFGEMALLESLPRSATATAVEPARMHLLYRTKLDALLHSHPRIGVAIMSHFARLLSARLRRTSAAVPAAAADA